MRLTNIEISIKDVPVHAIANVEVAAMKAAHEVIANHYTYRWDSEIQECEGCQRTNPRIWCRDCIRASVFSDTDYYKDSATDCSEGVKNDGNDTEAGRTDNEA